MKETRQGYLQIVTKYKDSCGRTHLRVSTIAKMCVRASSLLLAHSSLSRIQLSCRCCSCSFANPKSDEGFNIVRAGFDQEAATVLMTRLAVHKVGSPRLFLVACTALSHTSCPCRR